MICLSPPTLHSPVAPMAVTAPILGTAALCYENKVVNVFRRLCERPNPN